VAELKKASKETTAGPAPTAKSEPSRSLDAASQSDNKSNGLVPTLSLPKGGGAIRGMGEKFAVNPVTGTASMTVPIPMSPGRAGFGPQLSLSYDSGSGNGPFGFGWSLSLPSITRKTDKGLPQYDDAGESDVYVLSGAEDLVPVLEADGSRSKDDVSAPGFTIHQYRPRIEGLFARIERWTNRATGEIHWRSITRENVTTLYGRDNNSRIFDPSDPDPAHPSRIFTWLICASYDDKGNAIVYEYAPENDAGVDRTLANERNRTRVANRYLKRVKYGNRVSHLVQPDLTLATWLFEVVFDYDEGYYEELPLDQAQPPDAQHQLVRASWKTDGTWTARPDAFSSHRAGFEVRSYRRCRRALVFHRFPELNQDRLEELADEPYLVRAIEFEYKDLDYTKAPTIDDELGHQGSTRFASFIQSITQSGFVRDDDKAVVERGGVKYITYLRRALPPLEFEYSKATIQDEVRHLDAAAAENLPVGVDGSTYQWVDLDGEGVSGILTEQGGAWFYKPNLGEGRFGALQVVRTKPSLFAMASGGTQLLDLSGDGQLDVVSFSGPTPGFYERTLEESWETFRTFRKLPNLNWNEPNLRFLDLDGDGHADILITEDNVFTWYPSLAEDGFGPARQVHQPRDEERGPRLVLADQTQSIYLADLCGDGLTDLVRIRNSEVCYWPNLGYGRFGAKVTMDNAPWFDNPDQFELRRIRLADIEGSGTTDIIYLHRDGVRIYFNQSGNRWSKARHLPTFPRVDNLSSVSTADLRGNGTACLVWSSPLPTDSRRPLRYIDLMGQKPHLLVRSTNNLGAETKVDYASSTKFYLADKAAGNPWITRLPLPVHVIERMTTFDRISGNRFVSSYKYHHGYFDGVEREFRGFGMVEQKDTEEFATFAAGAQPGATNVDAASHVPPVLTKTWFHTGIYLGRDHVSDFFAGLLDDKDVGEYYREPGLTDDQARERLLPDTVLPESLTIDEEREACRALKGMMLRQEVYALDADDNSSLEEKKRAATPYTVVEQNFTLERLQPRLGNRHGVFFAHPREVLSNHYERNAADPRISHALTLDVDPFGNVLKSLAVAYGRRTPSTDPALTAEDKAKQSQLLITYTQSSYTQNEIPPAILAEGHHRAPIPVETRTYELTGFAPEKGARFNFEEWSRNNFALLASVAEVPYELKADVTKKQKRLIEDVRTLYRKDDLSALSPLGKVESQALPGETYKLALTPSLLAQVFTRKQAGQPDEALLPNPSALLEGTGSDQGGYVAWDGNWWIPSGKVFLDSGANTSNPALTAAIELSTARQHFFVPRKIADAFGQSTAVDYDAHDLLVTRTTDPVGNSVSAANDYRVLQPREVTDPNRNRSASAFDAIGMVVATAVMGKPGQPLGDVLEDSNADPTLAKVRAFIADPQAEAPSLLGKATTRIVYDLDRYRRVGQPPFAATLARETHFEPTRDGETKIQLSFSFSDGFGREFQKKIQAEPGKARKRQNSVALPSGDIEPGKLEPGEADAPRRWVGSGRTVFNNKGKPVKQYEPFFSATHLYESEPEVTDTGVSPVLFYDPVERVVATLHPNHTYEKVVFDPWTQTTFDMNDTVAAAQGQPQFATRNQTGDPRTDPDIAGYVREYFKSQSVNWETWLAQRIGNAMGVADRDAARKAEAHANTPTTAHLDVLGRAFVTLAHNKVVCSGHALDGTVDRFATRVDLDIVGNQRAVRDAIKKEVDAQGNAIVDELGRIVMRYDYDLLGNRIHQASMEAGERWMLSDAVGRPIRAWDSRLFLRRMTYDELRRPIGLFVTENGVERLAERTVYGEGQGDADNHRGQIYKSYDGAGVVTNVSYDFKGNLQENKRELLATYRLAVNWLQNPAATDGTFPSSTTFDALNRPLTVTSPDGSVHRPTFNEANLLDKVEVELRGAGVATAFVTNIDYNAKGQREKIDYKNGATTTYEYDPLTFRLSRLTTTRPTNADATASQLFKDLSVVQDLRYSYDPVGNITRIEDVALKTITRNGQDIEPVGAYTYDAVYRLIEAKGREHIGQNAFDFNPPNSDYRDYPLAGHRAHPNDLQALRHYTERYEYDSVGNFVELAHRFNGAGWTRRYEYEESSLIEAGKKNDRLTRTTVGNGLNQVEPYTHDAHGNMTSMAHLAAMVWDFNDELQQADLGGGGTAYYVYDGAGQRVRKVIESQNGARQKERLYLGGVEIYREYDGAGISLERESLHVLDDKQRIALVETQTIQNGNAVNGPMPLQRYQLGNHLGSSSVELDKDGALIGYEEYHPYGTTSFQAGRSAAEVSFKRYRYTGKERDDETRLYYHGARYYACWLGRWTSADSSLADGPNLFAYVRENPIVLHDPNGRQAAVAVPVQPPPPVTLPPGLPANDVVPWSAPANDVLPVVRAAPASGAVPAAAGFAVWAAALLTSMGLTVREYMMRSGSIARYGNPFGQSSQGAAFPVLSHVPAAPLSTPGAPPLRPTREEERIVPRAGNEKKGDPPPAAAPAPPPAAPAPPPAAPAPPPAAPAPPPAAPAPPPATPAAPPATPAAPPAAPAAPPAAPAAPPATPAAPPATPAADDGRGIEKGKRSRSGAGTEHYESIEDARRRHVKGRPQIKGPSADEDWVEGKRPKQTRIHSTEKSKQRDTYERGQARRRRH
jgi:RHS repeat-associated protein